MVILAFLLWANFTRPVFRANTGGARLRKMRAGGLPLSLPISSGFMLKRKRASLIGQEIVIYVPLLNLKHLDYRCCRIGPFAHGECRNGGLPDWLYGRAIPVRSNDERYLFYVRHYFAEIAKQVDGLLFKEGGPVVGIQIENEYMHAGAPWEVTFKQGREWVPAGSAGIEHLQLLKRLATQAGLEVPFYSCTGWGGSPVPADRFFPMQSAYAFTPWVLDPEFQQRPTGEFLFRDRHAQSVADE